MIPSSNSSDRSVSIRLKSSKAKPIQVLKNKLLKAFLGLSKSYGTAKAEIINEDGHTESINTNDHPKQNLLILVRIQLVIYKLWLRMFAVKDLLSNLFSLGQTANNIYQVMHMNEIIKYSFPDERIWCWRTGGCYICLV